MVRRTLAALGLVIAGLVLLAPAASAQYEDPGSIIVDNPNPDVGDSITVTGTACGEPGTDVTVSITQNGQTVVLGTTTTGPDGSYTITATIPGSFTNGTAVITDTCGGQLTLTIGGTGTVAATALPRTGSDTGMLTRVAVALVAAGGVLVLTARKRATARV
jgi:LPXTG-motif cell wall-anchored protein